jgi:adenosine deaminase
MPYMRAGTAPATHGATGRALALARAMPNVELHLHLEGTLEPEMMLDLARRNGVRSRFGDADEVRRALEFHDLQSFLDLYYEETRVLRTRQDFHDLTAAYLARARADGIRHTEVFLDPQSHTSRGVSFGDVVLGVSDALGEARERDDISSRLICCFLRHLSEADAYTTLGQVLEYRDLVDGVGLDSGEVGNPPSRFAHVFAEARRNGLWAVAHAGEEGPPRYIWQALDLGARRIDHGVRCLGDDALVARLVRDRVPLTVCPLSNVRLHVVPDLAHHPVRQMLDRGLVLTLSSDDPAYFGGYLGTVLERTIRTFELTEAEVAQIAANAIEAAVLDEDRRATLQAELATVRAAISTT